jgi:hypothetical protein
MPAGIAETSTLAQGAKSYPGFPAAANMVMKTALAMLDAAMKTRYYHQPATSERITTLWRSSMST